MNAQVTLPELREDIAQIDRRIVELLAVRVKCAREIGDVKRATGIATVDPAREAAIIRHAATLAREAGVPEENARNIFWQIVAACRGVQLESR
jgi:chorismate mutase